MQMGDFLGGGRSAGDGAAHGQSSAIGGFVEDVGHRPRGAGGVWMVSPLAAQPVSQK